MSFAQHLIINEIAPTGTADFANNDWIEIYVAIGGDYTGYTIYEGNTLVSSFSVVAFNPVAGDYIVVHEEAGVSESDATGKGANGYWDIYGAKDFTGTDMIISVRDTVGTIWIDAVGYSNKDGDAAGTFAVIYDTFQIAGMWAEGPATFIDTVNDAEVQAALVTVPGAGSSRGRDNVSADTNLSADWVTQTTPSPGAVNITGSAGGSASIGDMLVSEICVEGSSSYFSSNDWVELYVVNSGNYSGCLIYEADTVVKTFPPNFNPVAGDYIVIHEETGTDETDASGDTNSNGYWDFYGGGDYTATDNIVSVRSPSGNWVDAMGFSNQDGDMTVTNGTAYNNMVSTNMWTNGPDTLIDGVNDADVQTCLADYSDGGSNKSIVRLSTGTDTNSNIDWAVTSILTPGTSSAVTSTSTSGRISAKITEIAPGISKGDFVEIFVTAASADAGGCKLYEGTTLIKTFPSNMGALAKDTFIVLWACDNTSADETSADENGNGWIDLYSDETTAGLTNTDNNITLKNADGSIVDFMSFANSDTSYSGATAAYDAAVTAQQWSPVATSAAEYVAGSVGWSGSTSKSMYRLAESGAPGDTGAATDWTEGSTTIGYGDYGGALAVTIKSLEVFQSPFSPYNDGTYRQAKLSYYLGGASGDYQVTLQVFDVKGRSVRILLDHVDGGGGSSTVSWDGRDDNGNIVRTGIYIVHIESLNTTTGLAKRTSERVVVARKM